MDHNGLYLASASPRRAELLTQIGVRFRIWPANVDEAMVVGESAQEMTLRLAKAKAERVVGETREQPAPVLGADTAVVIDGDMLGKPADPVQAEEMLRRLSGRVHQVVTGVALAHQGQINIRVNVSEVRFRSTTRQERLAYCRSEEPWDKAGGYAIQGLAAVFVSEIRGSFSGVMGLPLHDTANLLRETGQPAWLGL